MKDNTWNTILFIIKKNKNPLYSLHYTIISSNFKILIRTVLVLVKHLEVIFSIYVLLTISENSKLKLSYLEKLWTKNIKTSKFQETISTTFRDLKEDYTNELSGFSNKLSGTMEKFSTNLSSKNVDREGMACQSSELLENRSSDKSKVVETLNNNDEIEDDICDFKLPEVDWENLEARLKEAQLEINTQVG